MADPILTNEDAVTAGYPNLATYRLRARGEARRAAQAAERERIERRRAEIEAREHPGGDDVEDA